ncbi:MAG TPA: hypothetical protein VMR37_04700 [Rhabdochlamydiaceae bacterium]|jgi:hypothetical protein|nr:hypothetical protein [Rhabdochlamydiaceae bacterium]
MAIATFHQMRSYVNLGPSNWFQDRQTHIVLVEKKETRESLKGLQFIQHVFGYGPFGYHSIQRTIERVAEECRQELISPLLPHFEAIQAQPEPDRFKDDLIAALRMIDKIDTTESMKEAMHKKVRSQFFEHATTLGKCCLLATTALEKVRKIFQAFRRNKITKSLWFIDRVKQIFGYGPLGYHTIKAAMEQAAKKCSERLIDPHAPSMEKIQTGRMGELTIDQIGTVLNVLERVEQIEQNHLDMQKRAQIKFLDETTGLGNGVLQMTSAMEFIRKMFRTNPQTLQRMAVYELLIRPIAASSCLWRAKKVGALMELYFAASGYSHELKLFKNKKLQGHLVFRKDTEEKNDAQIDILTIELSSAKDPEANEVFYRFLVHLIRGARISHKYEPGIEKLVKPEVQTSFAEKEMVKETVLKLENFASILEKLENGTPFPNLVSMRGIVAATAAGLV